MAYLEEVVHRVGRCFDVPERVAREVGRERQPLSVLVSIRQHTSAYFSIAAYVNGTRRA